MNHYNPYPSGSEWRKWDLHAHTPMDHEWDTASRASALADKAQFAKRYVECAIQQNIAVIAITDHNFYENPSESFIPHIQKEAITSGVSILPGFEVTAKDLNGVHVLVVFPEDTRLEIIKNIIDSLFHPGAPKHESGRVLPCEKSIEEIAENIRAGKAEALLLFAHADGENGVLNKKHNGEYRIRCWHTPHVCIAQLSRPPDQFSKESFCYNAFNGINPEYSRDIAYILASDCRTIELNVEPRKRNALGDKFSWIKADPTFNGLKQIMYEPLERILLSPEPPLLKHKYQVISRVRFVPCPDSVYSPDWINLNENLNVIIGGKSTGKSLLLYCIAETIDSEQVKEKGKISKTVKYSLANVGFEVQWGDGHISSLHSGDEEQRKITYLPQLYINRLVEGENRPNLRDTIIGFLKQREPFRSEFERRMEEIRNAFSGVQTAIDRLFDELDKFHELQRNRKQMGDRDAVVTSISEAKGKIDTLRKESGLTQEQNDHYQKLETDLQKQVARFDQIGQIKQGLSGYNNTIEKLQNKFIEGLQNAAPYGTAEPSELDAVTSAIGNALVPKIRDIVRDAINLIEAKVAEYDQEISRFDESKRVIEAELEPLKQKLSNKARIDELQKRLGEQETELIKIKTADEDIEKQLGLIASAKTKIHRSYQTAFSNFLALAEYLNSDENAHLDDDITLKARLSFRKADLYARFCNLFDLRGGLGRIHTSLTDCEDFPYSEGTHADTIAQIVESIINSDLSVLRFKSEYAKRDAVRSLCGDFFEIEYALYQGNEEIMQMSPGKQGLVLLELFLHLSNDKHPILIDQPEDNLDNRTISTALSDFVKRKKRDRQIILVSHNPNLVITTDSENIVVANQDGENGTENAQYKFEYVSGAIENSFEDTSRKGVLCQKGIREHICEVMEGGREAFMRRERRYEIRRS